MDIVGGGRVFVYPDSDELPHTPGDYENWQESFVIIWYDLAQSIGGLLRLGHEPNFQGGRSQIMSNIFSPEGVHHRSMHLPLAPCHRLKNGLVSGDDTLRYEYDADSKKIRWTLNDDGVSAKLEVNCFVPPIDAHRREGSDDAHSYTGNHVDAACGVTGTLTVKGKTYQVNALGIRDHGWGTRDWNSLLSHRWTVATFDENNSLVAMSWLTTAKKLVKFGWVIRDGKVIFAENVDIRAIIAHDGATNLGGTTRLALTTGEVLEARFEPFYPCIASWIHQTINFDAMSRVTWGDHVGFGVFESTCNIQGGSERPSVFDGAIAAEGWHYGTGPLL
jgi:YD repeat-containing protein